MSPARGSCARGAPKCSTRASRGTPGGAKRAKKAFEKRRTKEAPGTRKKRLRDSPPPPPPSSTAPHAACHHHHHHQLLLLLLQLPRSLPRMILSCVFVSSTILCRYLSVSRMMPRRGCCCCFSAGGSRLFLPKWDPRGRAPNRPSVDRSPPCSVSLPCLRVCAPHCPRPFASRESYTRSSRLPPRRRRRRCRHRCCRRSYCPTSSAHRHPQTRPCSYC